jgi:hypothetical protein
LTGTYNVDIIVWRVNTGHAIQLKNSNRREYYKEVRRNANI